MSFKGGVYISLVFGLVVIEKYDKYGSFGRYVY